MGAAAPFCSNLFGDLRLRHQFLYVSSNVIGVSRT